MQINVQIDPVSERDSLDLWRTKTNQIISTAGEVADSSGYSDFVDSQFRHISSAQDNLSTTFGSGSVRRKTVSYKIPQTAINLVPRAKNLVYVDFYEAETSPIKTIPIEFFIESNLPYTTSLGTANVLETDDIKVSAYNNLGVLTPLIGQSSNLAIATTDQYWIDFTNNTITFQSVASPAVTIGNGTRIYLTSSISDIISKPDIVPLYIIDTNSTGIDTITDIRAWVYVNTYNTPESAVPAESVFYVENSDTDTLVLNSSADDCVVYFDGVRQILDIDYTQTASNTIKSKSILPVGTQVTVVTYSASGSENVYAVNDIKTATTNGQTEFIITNFAVDSGVYLWINGIRQSPSNYTVDASLNKITLSAGVPAGTVLYSSKNVFSSTGFVYSGGLAGQIAEKQSSIDDDWVWVDPQFDADKFTTGTYDNSLFPFVPWYLSNPLQTDYVIAPDFLKYARLLAALDSWKPTTISEQSDYHFSGQNRHALRGEGHTQNQQYYWTASGYAKKDMDYYETYVAQKYGRIVKNPYEIDSSFVATDVPNAPFAINDITTTRLNPIDRTAANSQKCYKHLIAVGDSGKIAYSKNIVTSSLAKSAVFEVWEEMPLNSSPFNSSWNITSVESIIFNKRVEVAPNVTEKEGWDIIFVAAYNPTTGKSNVAWKLGVDLDVFTVPWNYLHGATGIAGKVTNIGSINTDDSRAVAWAIGDTVYGMVDIHHAYGNYTDLVLSRATTANKPTVSYPASWTLPSTLYGSVGEVATLIHCTPIWNNPNASTGAFWSVATESGNVYVRTSVSYTANYQPHWNPAKLHASTANAGQKWQRMPNFNDSGNIKTILCVGSTDQYPDSNPPQRATYYLGDGVAKTIGYHNGTASGYEVVPHLNSIQCGYLANAPAFVDGNIVSGVENTSPYHEGPNAYHSNKMIVQSEAGDIAFIDYAIGSTYSLDFMSVKQIRAFTSEKSPVPPVDIFGVASNGSTQVSVASKPVNCAWITTNDNGGTPMPLSGDVFGVFYEGNKFIIVTSRYIYSAGDNLVWSKFEYRPNSDNKETCDLTYTKIGTTDIWFLANGYDSAYSNNATTWNYYNKLTSGTAIKPSTIQNSVVSFGGVDGSSVVGFYDGRGLTPVNPLGQISPTFFNNKNIGYLAPVTNNLNATTWLFNLRDVTSDPAEIKTIKLTGVFQNSAGQVGTVTESLVISSQNATNFDVTRDTTTASKYYGTTYKWDMPFPNGARYLVAGNQYELLINDTYVGSLAFEPSVPKNNVTSAGTGVILGIDTGGRIVKSINGVAWENYPDSYIDKTDVLSGVVGQNYLQPLTEEDKFTAIQYNEFIKAYVASRRNGCSVVIYDSGLIEDNNSYLITLGSVNDSFRFLNDGEYITDLSGKRFIMFAKTNRDRILFGISGYTWYVLNSPIHPDDVPSTITYDNLGNHFVSTRKINSKTGKLPQYYKISF